MNPYKLIEKIYKNNEIAKNILITHSNQVKNKAIEIALNYQKKFNKKINMKLIENGSILHDIGIIKINEKRFNCFGKKKYINHGYEGFKILLLRFHPKIAFISLRHTGSGISRKEIIEENLQLPKINMIPKTIEEEIICLADKFYSKSKLDSEHTIEEILDEIKRYGEESHKRILYLINKYLN
ncbi:MAG: HD domain-containing protein [Candidatus Nanoarchaeia archaeon]|nr:HD domain-containing protein [Candidatus Nanoarchaeia archaeon]